MIAQLEEGIMYRAMFPRFPAILMHKFAITSSRLKQMIMHAEGDRVLQLLLRDHP